MDRTTREEFVLAAMNKQFELIGVSLENPKILSKIEFIRDHTITTPQFQQWRLWFIDECRRVFKMTKKNAVREFEYFNLTNGLKIKD